MSAVETRDEADIGDRPSEGDNERQQRVIVIIPAYNEERFIGSVVLQTRHYATHVVVVDDGSTDLTAAIAEAAGAIVVRQDRNRGKAAALNAGFRRARELGADVVVTIDADGQHRPEEMHLVMDPVLRGEADIVVGSRYLEQLNKIPRHRALGHLFFRFLTSIASGVPATDSQSGYRAFSARALRAFVFHSEGFSVESEMQFLVRSNNLTLVEVPITVRYLDQPKRSVVLQGLSVLNGVLRLVGQHRPLLFFGLSGLVLLGGGLLLGLLVVDIYRVAEQLAIGYALLTVLLCVVGVLALFAGLILHSMRGMMLSLLRERTEP